MTDPGGDAPEVGDGIYLRGNERDERTIAYLFSATRALVVIDGVPTTIDLVDYAWQASGTPMTDTEYEAAATVVVMPAKTQCTEKGHD